MTPVTEALREDHRNMARLLKALEAQIDVFARAERPDYDIVTGVADYFLEYPVRCHHPKEDLIVAKLAEHDQAGAVAGLAGEHRDLHEQVMRFDKSVRALLNGGEAPRSAIAAAARDFVQAQYRHMRAEEDLLFNLAEEVLTAADWADIERRLERGVDPVFGPWIEDMFRALKDKLLAWQTESEAADA